MSALRFLAALRCVTAIPVNIEFDEDSMRGLAVYLPTVGLVIGAVLFATQELFQLLVIPPAVASILLIVLWLALTGGIHFDGLMDTADGVFSHQPRERMLEIMRDSRVGNFAVITGICVFALKIAGLIALNGDLRVCALFLIPAWARWCETWAIGMFPYARDQGMGKIWHDSISLPGDLFKSAILPVGATVLCAITWSTGAALAVTFATIACGLFCASYLSGIIKGHTGDTYGATVELAETGGLVLLTLAAPFSFL